jgi:TPP-dependent pyruvate/acetoin dehydrogenase alpha subunit
MTLLVAETFRMGGHATHDEREARVLFDAATFARWGKRDPVGMFEAWLVEEGVAPARLEEIEAAVAAEVEAAAEEALRSRETSMPEPRTADLGVYA